MRHTDSEYPNWKYTSGELAEIFLSSSRGWLQGRINDGMLDRKDGNEIGVRIKNARGGDHAYTLDDVVEVAKSLKGHGVLDERNYRKVLKRVEVLREEVIVSARTSKKPVQPRRG